VATPLVPLVLFDLDGTLVDTAPDLRVALDALLARHGRPPCDPTAFRATVSRGGAAMLTLGFPELDPEPRLRLLPEFLALYDSAIAAHSVLFDGMDDVLRAIERQGRWGIVTNKPERLATRLVESMGLSSRCAVLIGGDTLPTRKPDPAPLLEACRRLGAAAGGCIYVGDDRRDIEAARAAAMRSVGARWGYFDPGEDIEAWGADFIAECPRDLLDGPLYRLRA
jgi:phosphoglycolate phosphatase